jgi:hypothetical protein
MGQVQIAQKAILFAGLLYNDTVALQNVCERLQNSYGKISLYSRSFRFTETDYYAEEMGRDLTRIWVGFDTLIYRERIVGIKHQCNELEESFTRQRKRNVNIDPGYLTLGKVVLATTKDNQHRLYLDDGIYGEVTLRYRNRSYDPWEWTFKDYRRDEAVQFFIQLRSLYRGQLRDGEASAGKR